MKRLSVILLLLSIVVLFSVNQMKASETRIQSEEMELEGKLAAIQIKLTNVSSRAEYDALMLELKQILPSETKGVTYNCVVNCYLEYSRCLANCNNTTACQGYCNLALGHCNRACQ